jgi:hypothetical protein
MSHPIAGIEPGEAHAVSPVFAAKDRMEEFERPYSHTSADFQQATANAF